MPQIGVSVFVSGTATLGTTPSPADDYSVPGTTLNSPASTRSVTIPLGDSYAIFNVYPISDVWFEGNETVIATLAPVDTTSERRIPVRSLSSMMIRQPQS